MMTETTTFAAVVAEMASAFETAKRDDGTVFMRLGKDCPAWVDSDLMMRVHRALDDRFPDDWVYEIARSIVDYLNDRDIEDADDARDSMSEIADGLVDVYNAERSKWLASNLNNAYLVDDAVDELGCTGDMFERIGAGQYMAIERIGFQIVQELEDEVDARCE